MTPAGSSVINCFANSWLVGGADAGLRVEPASGHLVGVALLRYISRVEPIASVSVDELVTRLQPALE
jgi:hypothetical protein